MVEIPAHSPFDSQENLIATERSIDPLSDRHPGGCPAHQGTLCAHGVGWPWWPRPVTSGDQFLPSTPRWPFRGEISGRGAGSVGVVGNPLLPATTLARLSPPERALSAG